MYEYLKVIESKKKVSGCNLKSRDKSNKLSKKCIEMRVINCNWVHDTWNPSPKFWCNDKVKNLASIIDDHSCRYCYVVAAMR